MRLLMDDHGSGLGRGLGDHQRNHGLHQPHPAARGAGELAGAHCSGSCCRACWTSSLRSTARFLAEVAQRWPGDTESPAAHVHHRGRLRAADSHGLSGHCRHLLGERRGGAALAAPARRAVPRLLRSLARRSSTTRPTASRPRRWLANCNPELRALITETIGDQWVSDLAQIAKLASHADERDFRKRWHEVKTGQQGAARQAGAKRLRRRLRSRRRSSTCRSSASTSTSASC